MALDMDESGYNKSVEEFRELEYPMIQDAIYLDHAGTTLPAKSLMESFATDIITNLYGNPHSGSVSSQLSMSRIEDTRLNVLRFFKADPEDFDIIFLANATAGIKLVMDSLREVDGGFSYVYHRDSHTSLIGVRENAVSSRCVDDQDVEDWLARPDLSAVTEDSTSISLFAYPAQSNMDGRRLPLSWLGAVRKRDINRATYTLLDAASFVSSTQLDLSDARNAPDFTVLSFYKIFGFPDLGALIVRKDTGNLLQQRKYFGGGTVDVVLCVKEQWHAQKTQSLHDSLEDGTLPIHNIMALDGAIVTHRRLYESMDRISKHTSFLASKLYEGLKSLRHANLGPVCVMYSQSFVKGDSSQGPIVAFNIRTSQGAWVSNTEFEKLASVRKFHIRSGGLCNPGGVATCLNLQPWEMRQNFSAGFKCGSETDIYAGKITGVVRASLGAMSTLGDVKAFISFVREFYAEKEVGQAPLTSTKSAKSTHLVVESLTIYPIKSCGGHTISPKTPWEVRPEGLAWDREWCLIHQGTGQAMSQKRHPRMALIRPVVDFEHGDLRIRYGGPRVPRVPDEIRVPLSANPAFFNTTNESRSVSSRVCGDAIVARTYIIDKVNAFFSGVLGVDCVLARFPAGGSGISMRHSKAHMQKHQRPKGLSSAGVMPGAFPDPLTPPDSDSELPKRPILLSNESPILAINRASLDALNDKIKCSGGKPASAAVFRANIVLAPTTSQAQPYAEDDWATLRIGEQDFQMLGSCRRCHMICVDQDTGEKDEEPFVTLAKTRRFDSKLFFGSHMCHIPSAGGRKESQYPTISVGETVLVGVRDE